jgi:pSer/pThr/pTyr-binding forkhead associated (FHA) protein
VLEGEERRHEIRFVRNWGGKTEVTFGRNPGEPYLHVQLHSRTVSRLHARLSYDNDAWHLTNLSTTNPTVLNNEPLAKPDEVRALNDGDKIEMGEVVFLFREK